MKIHLRANKIDSGKPARALCAVKSLGNGTNVYNSRRTYTDMASAIVPIAEFKLLDGAVRCAHCTTKVNLRRAAKDLPAV